MHNLPMLPPNLSMASILITDVLAVDELPKKFRLCDCDRRLNCLVTTVIGCQAKVIGCQAKVIGCQAKVIGCQAKLSSDDSHSVPD